MNYAQKITTIRGRSQLTIPKEIRNALNWPENDVIVKVETTKSGFKVEQLHISHPQNPNRTLSKQQWQDVFKSMDKVSKSGSRKVDLTEVLRKDRDSHF